MNHSAGEPLPWRVQGRPFVYRVSLVAPADPGWFIGVMNHRADGAFRVTLPLEDIGLQAGEPHIIYNVGADRLTGDVTNSYTVGLPAESAGLLVIRPAVGRPLVVCATGARDLPFAGRSKVSWDALNSVLSGVTRGAPDRAIELVMYTPQFYNYVSMSSDDPAAQITLPVDSSIRLRLPFTDRREVRWELQFAYVG